MGKKSPEATTIPTSSTTTRSAPDWLEGYTRDALNNQQRNDALYNDYIKYLQRSGDLAPEFTADEMAGRESIRNFATGDGLGAVQDYYNTIVNNGLSFDSLAPGLGGLLSELSSQRGVNEFLDPTAYNSLQSVAAGDYLSGDLFNRELQAGVDEAKKQVASMFSGGSGLAQANLGAEVGRVFDSNLSNRRNEMLGAANALAGLSDAEANRRMGAVGMMGDLGTYLNDAEMRAADNAVKYGTLEGALLSGLGQDQRSLEKGSRDEVFNILNQQYQRNFPFINPQTYITTDTQGEQTVFSNPGAGLAGGILSGLGLAADISGAGGLGTIFSGLFS